MQLVNSKEGFFSEKTGKVLAIFGISTILISAIIFIIFGNWKFSSVLDESKVAMFGDFIGGVVGSILAFAGIILYYVALKEQRREISISQKALEYQVEALNHQIKEFRDQTNEMQETRKTYEKQTIEFEKQTQIAKLKQFDSSFYSLLNVYIDLKKNLDVKDSNRNFFKTLYEKLKRIDFNDSAIEKKYGQIINNYIEIFYQNYSNLVHYFNTVYRLIQMIDRSEIENYEKEVYAKILRSQFTSYELLLLYYDYHSPFGEKVRLLSFKYQLLKHLPILDRIEYEFEENGRVKSLLSLFLSSMNQLIVENFRKFNDIESTTDIDISERKLFINLDSIITLKINKEFKFCISFGKETFINQKEISSDFIKKNVSICIFDSLFLLKYRIPNQEILQIEYIEANSDIRFSFVIDNLTSI